MSTRLALTLLMFLLPAFVHASSRTDHPTPEATWPRSTAEAQGMSSDELATMLQQINEDNPGIRSLTVIRHGSIVLEARIAPFRMGDRQDIHSCTKSVLSALVGIAIARGELPDPDTRVLEFFPEFEVGELDADKSALTMSHLLSMSAGLETQDSYLHGWSGLRTMHASDDWARYILGLPLVAKPGTRFEYSNCVSQLITIILQRATGMSVEDYAREHLFGPLGIDNFTWEVSGSAGNLGYSGLSMLPLDMARLGYLYLREGEWGGVQVVPADWIRKSTATRIHAGTMADGYGYQWWVDGDLFMMIGYGGQFVYVLPELDLLAVFTGTLERDRFFTPRGLFANYIEAAVVDNKGLPRNPVAMARLDSLTQVLGGQVRGAEPDPPANLPLISGQTFEFEANRIDFRSCALSITPGSSEAELSFVIGPARRSLVIGLDDRYRISDLNGQRWACRGHWETEDTFAIEQEVVGKVLRRTARLSFTGDTLSFEVLDRVSGRVEVFEGKLAGLRSTPD
jgi:CubicO group peptidase (beta-lactamase class C family)